MKIYHLNNKIKTSNFFSIYLGLNVFCKGIGLGKGNVFYKILLIIGFLFLLLKIFCGDENYKKSDYIKIFPIVLVGALTFVTTGAITFILSCICVAGMKNVNIGKEIRSMSIMRIVTFLTMVFLALTGVIENHQIIMWRNGHFDFRYCLGYSHPNILHLTFFLVISTYIFAAKGKIHLWRYIIMLILNAFIFHYSVSHTGFLCTIMVIFLSFTSSFFRGKLLRFYVKLPKIIFWLCIIASFSLAILYNYFPPLEKINQTVNSRIEYSNYYVMHAPLTLFGNRGILDDLTNLADNSYTLMYTQYGLLGLLTWIYLMLNGFNYVEKHINAKETSVMIIVAIYLLSESFGPNAILNIGLLLGGANIFKKEFSISN